jgi:hypothetical protein
MEDQILCAACQLPADNEIHQAGVTLEDGTIGHEFLTPEVHVPVSDDGPEEESVPVHADSETVDPQHDLSLPMFEGKQVVSILDDGRETETHYHCQMADGTTMHVPKELFLTE